MSFNTHVAFRLCCVCRTVKMTEMDVDSSKAVVDLTQGKQPFIRRSLFMFNFFGKCAFSFSDLISFVAAYS